MDDAPKLKTFLDIGTSTLATLNREFLSVSHLDSDDSLNSGSIEGNIKH